MSRSLESSELILTPEGRIYHLDLLPEDLAPIVITVGDPERVGMVSQYFDHIELKRSHREFCTHTGLYKGKRMTVISTGIGTDNIDIVLNELDALVNIDLKTRSVKAHHSSLKIVRIGTSGCLSPDIPVDRFLASQSSIGIDGLAGFYGYTDHIDKLSSFDSIYQSQSRRLPPPYWVKASSELLNHLPEGIEKGITLTCTGFYAPQGRELRLKSAIRDDLNQFGNIEIDGFKICNFEMETAAIYLMSHLLGHQALSMNALIANRMHGTFSENPKETVDKLIRLCLTFLSEH